MQDSSTDSERSIEPKSSEVKETGEISAEKRSSFFPSYFVRAKAILLSPRAFFADMPKDGGLLQPGMFLLMSVGIYSLLQAIAKLSPLVLVSAIPSSFVSVFLASAIISFACKKMGGTTDFRTAFKILAYSKATLLFAWVSLGSFPIGGILSLLYGVYLNIVGLTTIEKIARWKIITLVSVLALIGFIVKATTGL